MLFNATFSINKTEKLQPTKPLKALQLVIIIAFTLFHYTAQSQQLHLSWAFPLKLREKKQR